MSDDDPLSRFLELVVREMDADDVRAVARGSVKPEGAMIVATLGERNDVVVRFREMPHDIDARQRRLEMLASAFASAIDGAVPRIQPSKRSLRRELDALAKRADAIDAVVIDAHSPIVWGAAGPIASPTANVIPLNAEARERIERIQESHRDLIAALEAEEANDGEPQPDRSSATPAPNAPSPLSTRAVAEVRALPATSMLHRGGHLAYNLRGEKYGVVARSFAAIYVLILVFDKGSVVAQGDHAQLYSGNRLYQNLYDRQRTEAV